MLNGKIVVITGGAGRLGSVFSEAMVQAGARVVVADRLNAPAAPRLQELIGRCGDRLRAIDADITDRVSVDALIDAAWSAHGKVDALVNCAYPRNAHYGRRFEDVGIADFMENVGLHTGGYFLPAQRFLEHFRKQGHGNIVNVASIYGVVAPRFQVYEGTDMTMPVEYAVIKAGILHLTRYIASYHRGMGIRCNAISPGGIRAGQPDAFLARYDAMGTNKGMLDASDVCGTLLFLLSDASRYVNGQNIVVDDGWSL